MPPRYVSVPRTVVFFMLLAAFIYGPIPQLANYHDFADNSVIFGIVHGGDVFSNLPFLLVALVGIWLLIGKRHHPALEKSWSGYRLFLIGLGLTALGSAWYHLAPTNASLVWDRLPIALLCAGLLAGVWADTHQKSITDLTPWLAIYAVISVAWWYGTEIYGHGDLRLYLILQALPMLLIPLWQAIYQRPVSERLVFALALVFYALAKVAELNDLRIATALSQSALSGLTGHMLKHLLAAFAAALIVAQLVWRVRSKHD